MEHTNGKRGVGVITGERVIIRGIRKGDLREIYRIANKEAFRQLTGTQYPISEYEHEVWIQDILKDTNRQLFAVTDRATGKFLGTVGLKNFDYKNRNAELFIRLDAPGGYGTDTVTTLVRHCFRRLNMHKVCLKVFAYNTRAIRCYKKAGFQVEGVLREQHYEDGKYVDVLLMGCIANCEKTSEA